MNITEATVHFHSNKSAQKDGRFQSRGIDRIGNLRPPQKASLPSTPIETLTVQSSYVQAIGMRRICAANRAFASQFHRYRFKQRPSATIVDNTKAAAGWRPLSSATAAPRAYVCAFPVTGF
jgi:hypothetical protein